VNVPAVVDFGIHFYAGVPITTDSGHHVGSLCVADFKSRTMPANGVEILKGFAQMVERELVSRKLRQATDNEVVTVCAWTNRVRVADRWITPGEYLRLQGFDVTHGIADDVTLEDNEQL